MTYEEAIHQTNIAILRRLIKTYGINRSLGNVLTNEESILETIQKQNEKETLPATESEVVQND